MHSTRQIFAFDKVFKDSEEFKHVEDLVAAFMPKTAVQV
jgi:hypothetical protein